MLYLQKNQKNIIIISVLLLVLLYSLTLVENHLASIKILSDYEILKAEKILEETKALEIALEVAIDESQKNIESLNPNYTGLMLFVSSVVFTLLIQASPLIGAILFSTSTKTEVEAIVESHDTIMSVELTPEVIPNPQILANTSETIRDRVPFEELFPFICPYETYPKMEIETISLKEFYLEVAKRCAEL